MNKIEKYKVKNAEIEILNICRKSGIEEMLLVNLGYKLAEISAIEKLNILQNSEASNGIRTERIN
jgi:hypothetical protein